MIDSRPLSPPAGNPVPMPVPVPPGACGEDSSVPIRMTVGMCDGCSNLPFEKLLSVTAVLRIPDASGAGSSASRPRLTGVETTLAFGRPTVFHSGSSSKLPITSACNPNEVTVVQLRRVFWAQEVSSMLSANIMSSSVKICLLVWTPRWLARAMLAQRKKAAFSRGLLELSGHWRCPVLLLRRVGRLGRRGLRSSCASRGPRSRGLCCPRRRRSGHPRLHVVGVDDCFGNVDGFTPPQHIALRPGFGRVHDDSEAVVLRVLHDHGSHLLQHAARDLLLLVAKVF